MIFSSASTKAASDYFAVAVHNNDDADVEVPTYNPTPKNIHCALAEIATARDLTLT